MWTGVLVLLEPEETFKTGNMKTGMTKKFFSLLAPHKSVMGTVAVENPTLVREAARAFPGQVAVGIDARQGRVATKGWAEETDVMVTDLARAFEDAGVAAIVYTDIDRDGAMQGPNVGATAALARATTIPVIASGGVSSLADLVALRDCGAPLDGAISGRALYDGKLDLGQALRALKA